VYGIATMKGSLNVAVALLAATAFLYGCGPCGMVTDETACNHAVENAPRMANVKAGMTMAEVRTLMQRDPERREIDGNVETWAYITDYSGERMTVVVFTDGRVTGMRQAAWK
jgi:hypothetical protein